MEQISQEAISEIRKQAIQQSAKWTIAAMVALIGFAFAGWWFYFEPKIREYIVSTARGVPAGVIIASTKECSELEGKWAAYRAGTGRFVIGAGDEFEGAYGKWNQQLPDGAVRPVALTAYKALEPGGEESHILSISEMPSHRHEIQRGVGDNNNFLLGQGIQSLKGNIFTEAEGGGIAHNNLPPFIALHFCIGG